jgi:hypothetical protein
MRAYLSTPTPKPVDNPRFSPSFRWISPWRRNAAISRGKGLIRAKMVGGSVANKTAPEVVGATSRGLTQTPDERWG